MFNLRTWRFDDSLEAPSGKFTLPFRSSFSPPPRAFKILLTLPSLSPAEACSQTIHFSEGTNGERMMILQRRGTCEVINCGISPSDFSMSARCSRFSCVAKKSSPR